MSNRYKYKTSEGRALLIAHGASIGTVAGIFAARPIELAGVVQDTTTFQFFIVSAAVALASEIQLRADNVHFRTRPVLTGLFLGAALTGLAPRVDEFVHRLEGNATPSGAAMSLHEARLAR